MKHPQSRYLLQSPLQLASVMFAAASTPLLCGGGPAAAAAPRCIFKVSGLQLALGLALPAALVWVAEGRRGAARARTLPHMQTRRVLGRALAFD